jgi:hypothetical protein
VLDPKHTLVEFAVKYMLFTTVKGRLSGVSGTIHADLRRCAAELGLDLDQFERDRRTPAVAGRIDRDVASGERSGVEGTPTFFINGLGQDGPFDLDSLRPGDRGRPALSLTEAHRPACDPEGDEEIRYDQPSDFTLHTPGPGARRPPAHARGLRGLPEDRQLVGAPAAVPGLRTRGLLR